MTKGKHEVLTTHTGKVIKENGMQFFICGNNRIKISEHFAAEGRPLGDLIVDVVRQTAGNTAHLSERH